MLMEVGLCWKFQLQIIIEKKTKKLSTTDFKKSSGLFYNNKYSLLKRKIIEKTNLIKYLYICKNCSVCKEIYIADIILINIANIRAILFMNKKFETIQ